jgi:class 3 adenylate cyclase/tetratricopeptide (TPR) repeat protein
VESCSRCGAALAGRARFCSSCGAPVVLASTTAERRKVVSIVFADVVGSTALGERVDPETLRWAMKRWFGRMRAAIERHGGTVENYVGDGIMAVFGIPAAHEDDALRAVRAAGEMRSEVAALCEDLRSERGVDLAVRIGVNTGEAVTGAGTPGGSFTAGDTVNVAARLEQSAAPGDVLLGEATWRLVRHAVEAEPVAPLTVKGKSAPLEAFRLVAVAAGAGGRAQRPRAPMVGRQRERRRLLDAFHQAVADRSCQLCTVLGAAGVGKSRLVAEVVDTLGDAATVAAGRCLPYGDGLTWWPLVEALGQAGLVDEARAEAPDATSRVMDLLEPAGAPVAPDEARWAVRRVLETLARRRPLVLVVDDLQWAEPTFVEVVEHVAEWARDAPLVLLIMARPELLDDRPTWGGGQPNATSILLEPLPEAEASDLLHHLLGGTRLDERTSARILQVAEGNPLYVEEVVAMLAERRALGELAEGAIAVPPTIQALLAARLDRLSAHVREVVEAAAVEGKEFAGDRVAAMVGREVDAELRALVRTHLVGPAGPAEGTFRFRHQLVRDAAYEGMSKEARATLHERFADWLEEHRDRLPSADELIGHHLERVVVLRRELGAGDDALAGPAARAQVALVRAGRRATAAEERSAVRLLERALALARDPERAQVLVYLARALEQVGELLRAAALAREALDLASQAGDRRTAARARIVELSVTMGQIDTKPDLATFEATVRPVVAELEAIGDDEGLAAGLRLMGYVAMDRHEEAVAYLERAALHAERGGDPQTRDRAIGSLGFQALFGPVPATEAIERCRALRARAAGVRGVRAALLRHEAVLHAMRGDIDEARALHDEADGIGEELGVRWHRANSVFTRLPLELLAGAPERGERAARASLEIFESMHNHNQGSTAAAMLAMALVELGRHDEALEYADLAAAWAASDDVQSQITQLAVRARVLAARGDLEAAEAAARRAKELSSRADDPCLRADAVTAFAVVLARAGRADEAAAAVDEAVALLEAKGNVVGARQARALVMAEAPSRPA